MLQLNHLACQVGPLAEAAVSAAAAVDRQVRLAVVHLPERDKAALPEEHRAVLSPEEELLGMRLGPVELEVASAAPADRRVTPACPP